MKRTVIVRVTETEFETDDGTVYPHPIPFALGEVPSVEELQAIYDVWEPLLRGTMSEKTED